MMRSLVICLVLVSGCAARSGVLIEPFENVSAGAEMFQIRYEPRTGRCYVVGRAKGGVDRFQDLQDPRWCLEMKAIRDATIATQTQSSEPK